MANRQRRFIFNPDLTSHLCALTRFPIFGILRWILSPSTCGTPVGAVLSRFSPLASTGKQFDPTRGLSRFRDVEKRGGWKELDMDQRLNTIASKFLSESCACNLHSWTWRRWLSACLRCRHAKLPTKFTSHSVIKETCHRHHSRDRLRFRCLRWLSACLNFVGLLVSCPRM